MDWQESITVSKQVSPIQTVDFEAKSVSQVSEKTQPNKKNAFESFASPSSNNPKSSPKIKASAITICGPPANTFGPQSNISLNSFDSTPKPLHSSDSFGKTKIHWSVKQVNLFSSSPFIATNKLAQYNSKHKEYARSKSCNSSRPGSRSKTVTFDTKSWKVLNKLSEKQNFEKSGKAPGTSLYSYSSLKSILKLRPSSSTSETHVSSTPVTFKNIEKDTNECFFERHPEHALAVYERRFLYKPTVGNSFSLMRGYNSAPSSRPTSPVSSSIYHGSYDNTSVTLPTSSVCEVKTIATDQRSKLSESTSSATVTNSPKQSEKLNQHNTQDTSINDAIPKKDQNKAHGTFGQSQLQQNDFSSYEDDLKIPTLSFHANEYELPKIDQISKIQTNLSFVDQQLNDFVNIRSHINGKHEDNEGFDTPSQMSSIYSPGGVNDVITPISALSGRNTAISGHMTIESVLSDISQDTVEQDTHSNLVDAHASFSNPRETAVSDSDNVIPLVSQDEKLECDSVDTNEAVETCPKQDSSLTRVACNENDENTTTASSSGLDHLPLKNSFGHSKENNLLIIDEKDQHSKLNTVDSLSSSHLNCSVDTGVHQSSSFQTKSSTNSKSVTHGKKQATSVSKRKEKPLKVIENRSLNIQTDLKTNQKYNSSAKKTRNSNPAKKHITKENKPFEIPLPLLNNGLQLPTSTNTDQGKNIILCFDGTSEKFGPDPFSNVLKFFRMLDRTKYDQQLVYYQRMTKIYILKI